MRREKWENDDELIVSKEEMIKNAYSWVYKILLSKKNIAIMMLDTKGLSNEEIDELGFKFTRSLKEITGKYYRVYRTESVFEDNISHETSNYCEYIYDIEFSDALKIAKEYELDSIVFKDSESFSLLDTKSYNELNVYGDCPITMETIEEFFNSYRDNAVANYEKLKYVAERVDKNPNSYYKFTQEPFKAIVKEIGGMPKWLTIHIED